MEKLKIWFENSWWAWANAIDYRFVRYDDNIDRCSFFEELNYGWYQMYIYPYDNPHNLTISKEREERLGGFPQQYTFYVSEVDYDLLMDKMENPDPPSDALRKLFERKLPWDYEETT
jgi:hypothetical protein